MALKSKINYLLNWSWKIAGRCLSQGLRIPATIFCQINYLKIRAAMTRNCVYLGRYLAHSLTVVALFCVINFVFILRGSGPQTDDNVTERHGFFLALFIYGVQSLSIIPLPFFILNFLGVVFINVFTKEPTLLKSISDTPLVCFRVVTKGLYPSLVATNIKKNINTCKDVGFSRYRFEVVTDVPINIEYNQRVHEIVVPSDYKTSNGSLFKARALQYALEPDVDRLRSDSWIVHLDEETLLTKGSVIGILNFIASGKHDFGQGVITYGNGTIVNWTTTLADSIRVGIDYGCLRFCLGIIHKPLFNWKGSFVVARYEAEKDVSFDHGPESSVAEDCFFSCIAFLKGYSFGFVEGEMMEKSTFTIQDFVRQRQRWMCGIYLTARSSKIPLQYKIGPILMSLTSLTVVINVLLTIYGMIVPIPRLHVIHHACSVYIGIALYLFLLGTLQTFTVKTHGLLKCCFLVLATVVCAIIGGILEMIASFFAFWIPRSSSVDFYIVNKSTLELVFKE